MRIEKEAVLLQIYIGCSDQWQGRSLLSILMDRAKSEGLAGLTALPGDSGFGTHQELHERGLLALARNLPIRIEIVDSRERVERYVATVASMITEGTMTLTHCRAIRYLKSPGDPT